MKIQFVDNSVAPSYYIEILGINGIHGYFLIGLSLNKVIYNHRFDNILCYEDVESSPVNLTRNSSTIYKNENEIDDLYSFDTVVATSLIEWWIVRSNSNDNIIIGNGAKESIKNTLNVLTKEYI